MPFVYSLVHQVYLDGVVTVVDSKNCLTQMKGGGDPNASGGLSDWLRQVMIVKQSTELVILFVWNLQRTLLFLTFMIYGFDLDEFYTVIYERGVLLVCNQSCTI